MPHVTCLGSWHPQLPRGKSILTPACHMHLSATACNPLGQVSSDTIFSNYCASKCPRTQLPLAEYCPVIIASVKLWLFLPSPDCHCLVRTASAESCCLCRVLLPLHSIIASAEFCSFCPVMTGFLCSHPTLFHIQALLCFCFAFASKYHCHEHLSPCQSMSPSCLCH